jgi:hypothetical protein
MSYCFDSTPHFQYFNHYKLRPEFKEMFQKERLTESMSLQGSCFMLTRDKYWELNICDEEFGSWGSQGIEVACKTWLSGGRVVVNHDTWYAHLFRTQGGDFGFPYELSGKQTEHAKKLAKEVFFGNKLPKQEKPLSWLLEKFWPVPGWTEADLANLKGEPSVGVIYYTDNKVDKRLLDVCQKQLKKAIGNKPLVSVSLEPMDFGKNIVHNGERGYLTMSKQILTALENIDTDVVFFAEHDVLYHPSHFDFIPPDKNTWYYDSNYWFLRLPDGFAVSYECSPLSGLCVYRDIAIKHYKERIALMEKDNFKTQSMYQIGFEPMTHNRINWENKYPFKTWESSSPSIDIAHGGNVTKKRWSIDLFRKKPKKWIEGDINTISGWDNVEKLMKRAGLIE